MPYYEYVTYSDEELERIEELEKQITEELAQKLSEESERKYVISLISKYIANKKRDNVINTEWFKRSFNRQIQNVPKSVAYFAVSYGRHEDRKKILKETEISIVSCMTAILKSKHCLHFKGSETKLDRCITEDVYHSNR